MYVEDKFKYNILNLKKLIIIKIKIRDNTYDFLLFNSPLMFIFALICCEDTHYDSHY